MQAMTFISEIKNAVVIRLRSAIGVLLYEGVETFGSFIANTDHQSPGSADPRQVRFPPGSQRDKFVNGQQLGFKLARFGMKRRTKLTGNGGDSSFETRKHLVTQIL